MSIDFNYFYGSQAEQFSFYRIPKILFIDEMFSGISVESKVLYGFMLDRMCLSVKNCWFDDENRVYIIYTVEEIIKDFGCARQKVAKLLDELENEIGLIERRRQGLGKPNIIYVKNFIYKPEEKKYENQNSEIMNIENQEVCKSNLQKYENHTSRDMNIKFQEVPKSYANNTNINNTESNDTDFKKTDKNCCEYPSHLSYRNSGKSQKKPMDMIDEYNAYKEIIKENIEYDSLIVQEQKDLIDNIVDIMADVAAFPAESYYINQKNYPAELVKSVFLKINHTHISNMIMALDENQTKIRNIRSYLIAAIFNAYSTSEAYIGQRVRYDMQNWTG